MVKKEGFFLKKSIIATFGILALLGGFTFINLGATINPFTGQITGNSVLSNTYPFFSALSIVGLLLILCSAILIVYSIVKK